MRKQRIFQILVPFSLVLLFLVLTPFTSGQGELQLKLENVGGEVYCLSGAGGNIGIFKGNDTLLVIDATYARTANEVLAEIRNFCTKPIKFLINTHYHGDHTGGNTIIGKVAEIISHKNCKASFIAGLKPEETPGNISVPEKTFEKDIIVKVGDETVRLIHPGPAHTSGDTIVIFDQAKVIHAGDLFFHGMPPFIDVQDGANTKNWILTIKMLAEKYPDFKLIPGHGPVTDMKSCVRFAEYLTYLRKEVAAAIKAGKTREQAQESIDMTAFDWIKDRGQFLTKKENIGWVYDELIKKEE